MNKIALGALLTFLCAALPITAVHAGEAARKGAKKKQGTYVKAQPRQVLRLVAPAERERAVRRVTVINGKRKVVYQRTYNVGPALIRPTMGDMAGLNLTPDPLALQSNVAFVLDQGNSEILFEKNAGVALPIASITKMMTGLVVVEANQDMDEVLTVTDEDVDKAKFSSSRLKVGSQLTRANMLHIALMSSENRAASALGRNYPGGLPAFVDAMNAKARELGMTDTRYVDSSGLSKQNVASARDLAKLAVAAYQHPVLREYSTDAKAVVEANGRPMHFGTTNRLIATPGWEIGLQKTGFINEAGRCLLMQAVVQGRAVIMVLLDAKGSAARAADAGRMRKWVEALKPAGLSASPLSAGAVTAPTYSTGM
ncbi:serine hydrolase [Pseudoduganella namucuonensis]|uniref:D-alanyl-D-alanine endopeptidase (Penicillin-binding protein 7) n=1 Tax=Pseudoduganella namucuonensis TaxID=1035707 RepID=A0A1I7LQT1_9BURK|nr:serine hydrolase [Pseudoduganella namucuonensis]SFV11989.1 D-alanyl-D-alanine endopeptidase (penicillin-binding protein 7) [Pseudoduganella namucuonensis]